MYKDGIGVQKDYHEAMKYFLKAANQGNIPAQNNVGITSFLHYQLFIRSYWPGNMYSDGYGVQQDYHKAMEYYLKGANLGDSRAQFNVGTLIFLP